MSGETATVRLERVGRRATLWLDRPPLNILDLATLARLDEALATLEEDAPQVLVIRGAGGRAFSAGVAVQDHVPERIPRALELFHRALLRLYRLGSVSVAAVDGPCLGGGMELAAVCDLVLASDESRFGQPEIRLACFPPVATALLPSLIGPARAADLILTGRVIDAVEAERLGFVARRVPREGFEAALTALTDELLAPSTAALRLARKALRAGREQNFAAALQSAEQIYLDELVPSADVVEGVAAFLEKRPPRWTHR